MISSPLKLMILLHHYGSSEPWEPDRHEAPAVIEAYRFLIMSGMIVSTTTPCVYSVTEKGTAYVEYLMTVPFPQQHWIVPHDA